jgi:hypothetical protein
MAAGLTGKLVEWEDIIAIMDAADEPKKRGLAHPVTTFRPLESQIEFSL